MPQYQSFDAEDRIVETTKVTTGYFADGGGKLAGTAMTTASMTSSQTQYYVNVREGTATSDEFSLTFGHRPGSGSSDVTSHTKAIYQYYADLLLFPDEIETVGFQFNSGSTEDSIWVLAAERARMKDRLNRKNWTLTLGGWTGSSAASHVGTEAGGGSAGGANVLTLTDDSDITSPTPTPVGNRYNIITGSLGVAKDTSHATASFYSGNEPYGWFYPNLGLVVLNGNALSASIPGRHITCGSAETPSADTVGSGVGFGVDTATTALNHNKFYQSLQSGSFQARSEEDQITTSYFVRARAAHWNFSNNPTFYSGSDATFSIPEFTGNPQTFITTIGLHDAGGTMVAVGRLSTPVLKNFSREFTAKVNLVH